jgi:hypothetical protein
LKREFVKAKAEDISKTKRYISTQGGGHDPRIWLLALIIIFPIEHGIRHLPGTDVYITPAGYSEYKQEITWGKNKVYIPKRLKEKDFYLNIEIDGNYVGDVYFRVGKYQKKVELKK